MRRRQFFTALGGAAAWPLVAHGQQPVRRVAVLMAIRETDPEEQARLQALVQAMRQLGWTDGRDIRIHTRSAGGSAERSREIAAEFVSLAPDVIVTTGSVATAAMKRATTSIPVVFTVVNEPVAQGFVATLARPGGNITGFTLVDFSMVGKSVELLKTIAPALSRIALMFNPDTYPYYDDHLPTFQEELRRSVEVVRAAVRSPVEIDAAVETLAIQPGCGLVVLTDGGFTLTHRPAILAALERHPMPSIAALRPFASEGALMSYGPDTIDIFRRSAEYIDRILKGAKPAELPVQQPVKFELVINLKTARALDLNVSTDLLARADEVIE
jgi:putative tryptophan/tyrosine transport system substrate-binding protein